MENKIVNVIDPNKKPSDILEDGECPICGCDSLTPNGNEEFHSDWSMTMERECDNCGTEYSVTLERITKDTKLEDYHKFSVFIPKNVEEITKLDDPVMWDKLVEWLKTDCDVVVKK